MSWPLLLPAGAVVIALVALAFLLQRVEREVVALRVALRRSRRTAVASDELERMTVTVAAQAAELEKSARARIHRPRIRHHSGRR